MKNPAAFLPSGTAQSAQRAPSVLVWSAWLRVLAVVPAVLVLWLAVLWANLEAAPW